MGRRSPGEDTLFYSPSRKRWVARVLLPDGSRPSRFRRSKRAAQAALAELRGLRVDPPAPGTAVTLGERLQEYLAGREAVGRAPNTIRLYRHFIDKVIGPELGHNRLDALTPRVMQQFLDRCATVGDYQPRSLAVIRAILSGALGQAETWQLIARSPVRGTEIARPKDTEKIALSIDQTKALLALFPDPPMLGIVTLAACYALRESEVLGERLTDVGETALTVAGQLTREGAYRAKRKAGSTLTLPLVPITARALGLQRAYRERQQTAAGPAWREEDWLFCQDDGRALRQDGVRYRFARAVQGSGLPVTTFHDLRHVANSLYDELGLDEGTRMAIVGHSNRATNRRYTHTNEARITRGLLALSERLEA